MYHNRCAIIKPDSVSPLHLYIHLYTSICILLSCLPYIYTRKYLTVYIAVYHILTFASSSHVAQHLRCFIKTNRTIARALDASSDFSPTRPRARERKQKKKKKEQRDHTPLPSSVAPDTLDKGNLRRRLWCWRDVARQKPPSQLNRLRRGRLLIPRI